MKFVLYSPKVTNGILNMTVSSDASELAQLAIYVLLDCNEYPVSFCGTDKKEIQVGTELILPFGYSELILKFAQSNMADAIVDFVSINTV